MGNGRSDQPLKSPAMQTSRAPGRKNRNSTSPATASFVTFVTLVIASFPSLEWENKGRATAGNRPGWRPTGAYGGARHRLSCSDNRDSPDSRRRGSVEEFLPVGRADVPI